MTLAIRLPPLHLIFSKSLNPDTLLRLSAILRTRKPPEGAGAHLKGREVVGGSSAHGRLDVQDVVVPEQVSQLLFVLVDHLNNPVGVIASQTVSV